MCGFKLNYTMVYDSNIFFCLYTKDLSPVVLLYSPNTGKVHRLIFLEDVKIKDKC